MYRLVCAIAAAFFLSVVANAHAVSLGVFLQSKDRRVQATGYLNTQDAVYVDGDRVVDKVQGAKTLYTVPQFIYRTSSKEEKAEREPGSWSVIFCRSMQFQFAHPDLVPIGPDGEPNYRLQLFMNAEAIPVTWDKQEGYIAKINPERYRQGVWSFTALIRFPNVKHFKEWSVLGITLARSSDNEWGNQPSSLDIFLKPFDNRRYPIATRSDFCKISAWVYEQMGISATGVAGSTAGGAAASITPCFDGEEAKESISPEELDAAYQRGASEGKKKLLEELAAQGIITLNGDGSVKPPAPTPSPAPPLASREPIMIDPIMVTPRTLPVKDAKGRPLAGVEVKILTPCEFLADYGPEYKVVPALEAEAGTVKWLDDVPSLTFRITWEADGRVKEAYYDRRGRKLAAPPTWWAARHPEGGE